MQQQIHKSNKLFSRPNESAYVSFPTNYYNNRLIIIHDYRFNILTCYSIDMNDFTLEQIEEIVHKLERSQLSGANLSGCNLIRANLFGAIMNRVNLHQANLRGANLGSARLRKANLRGAVMDSANLIGADLRGANLQTANLQNADLTNSEFDSDTKWPSNFDPIEAGAILLNHE